MDKNVYSYSKSTGEFCGVLSADKSPLEHDVWLIPANATEIEPPHTGENEIAIFNGTSWEIKSDYRNQLRYSTITGEQVKINEIGQLPAGITDLPRPSNTHEWNGTAWIVNSDKENAIQNDQLKADLAVIDQKSIRSIREWISSQPNAPDFLLRYEDLAKVTREKLK